MTYTEVFHLVPVVSNLSDARGEEVVREGEETVKARTLSIPANMHWTPVRCQWELVAYMANRCPLQVKGWQKGGPLWMDH